MVSRSRAQRPADGEREFEELFRTYHAVIVAAAFNRLSDRTDAEDAAAEVFALAWRRRDDASQVFTLAWLYATLRNVVGNTYRGRTRRQRRAERAELELEGVPELASEEVLEVRLAVNRLDEADREVIWMAYWEDLSREEMAEILGCSAATLRVRLHRARRRLEQLLALDPASTVKEDAWTS
ncbi:RNA polymerase sigma factor [Agromyces soli]|uniref:Sigma-70 family RNA polymerase sigma factor n=1 Tax=Agromyces soli TaxID=659012 RepID=A0ABY4APH0_9MICO|nr:sigma-70 family RNA polymerase sigma factor [Agromyces soli]UOE25003.1 sigma-70 family RNA polymerase sigma factor [Agromyces soli]